MRKQLGGSKRSMALNRKVIVTLEIVIIDNFIYSSVNPCSRPREIKLAKLSLQIYSFNSIVLRYHTTLSIIIQAKVMSLCSLIRFKLYIFQVTFTTSYIVSKLTLKNPIVKIFIKKSSNGSIIFTLNSSFLITNLIVRCIDIFIQIN